MPSPFRSIMCNPNTTRSAKKDASTRRRLRFGAAADTSIDEKRRRDRRQPIVYFAFEERHLVDDVSTWYSKQELYKQQQTQIATCSSNGTRTSNEEEDQSIRHINTVLDAQELMDEIGTTDAASQANILAAVSAKSSEKARRRAIVFAEETTALAA